MTENDMPNKLADALLTKALLLDAARIEKQNEATKVRVDERKWTANDNAIAMAYLEATRRGLQRKRSKLRRAQR